MNGSCAGGTGAFIDQMATLLDVTADELDELSLQATSSIYPIASRCGVFAKSDIQPLLNQGGRQGGRGRQHLPGGGGPDHRRPGPGPRDQGQGRSFWAARSTSCKGLRERFVETLKLSTRSTPFSPRTATASPAIGAAAVRRPTTTPCPLTRLLKLLEDDRRGGHHYPEHCPPALQESGGV